MLQKQMIQTLGILLLGIAVGGIAVGWYAFHLHWDWSEREAFIQPAGEVMTGVTVLERLHAGETESAIELLEIKIDGGLVDLSMYDNNEFPRAQHDLIQGTLDRAKDYRTGHPRTNESPEIAAAVDAALSKAE